MFPFTHDADIGESTRSSDLSFEVPQVFDLEPDDPILLLDGVGEDDDLVRDSDTDDSHRSVLTYEIVLGFDCTD